MSDDVRITSYRSTTPINTSEWPEGTRLTIHGCPGDGWILGTPVFTVEVSGMRVITYIGGRVEVERL